MSERFMTFIRELVRRRVLRTAGVYLVAIWGLSQGAAELFPLFGASDEHVRVFIIGSLAFLPIVVILAWMYDIGGHGVKRDAQDAGMARRRNVDRTEHTKTVVARAPNQGCVRVTFRDLDGEKVVLLTGDFSLGRSGDCAIQFKDPVVSRQHARVRFEAGEWKIRDLGSTNGTWLDGAKVQEAVLPKESRIRVNEAGPPLQFSVLAPGPDTEQALAELGADASKALVRSR